MKTLAITVSITSSLLMSIVGALPAETNDTPQVSRVLLPDTPTRAIAVGFGSGSNVVIDSVSFTPLYIWHGDFVNLKNEKKGRGGKTCTLNGDRMNLNLPSFPLRVKSAIKAPVEINFTGYTREKGKAPVFKAQIDGVETHLTMTFSTSHKLLLSYRFPEKLSAPLYFLTGEIDPTTIVYSEGATLKDGVVTIPANASEFTIEIDMALAEKVKAIVEKVSGEKVYKQHCSACHSVNGVKLIGPTFKGLMGKQEVVLVNGEKKTITVGEEYLHSSIVTPQNEVVDGYQGVPMPPFKDVLNAEEIKEVINYIKTLK